MAALAAALLALGCVHWYVTASVYDTRIREGVLFGRAVTDGQEAMLDQETGLRGFQVTGDPSFLAPYREGQAQYLRASAEAWRLAPPGHLSRRLLEVQGAASAWQTRYAVPALAGSSPGRRTAPRDATLVVGRDLFDRYRDGYRALLQQVRASNNELMARRELLDRGASSLEVLLAAAALGLAARRRRRLADDVVRPVEELTAVLHQLADGDGAARPVSYPSRELDELSRGVRSLAEAAQRRREEADAERAAGAARAAVYEKVLAVAHELGSYLAPAELGRALLREVAELTGAQATVLRAVAEGAPGAPLAGLPTPDALPLDDLAAQALRFVRLSSSGDGREWALPVVHAGTVHGLLQVRVDEPLREDSVLALRNLALAAGGALTAARLHEQVHAESRSDALTGLHNRRRFEEDLQHELGLAGRVGVPFSLLLLDVDHFKRFNDTRGHREGDRLLRELAETLTLNLRSTDSAYRYGGEELAVLCRGTGPGDAQHLADRLRALVQAQTPVTVSVGVVTADGEIGPDALVESADAALYEAKHAGRNTVRTAVPPSSANPGPVPLQRVG